MVLIQKNSKKTNKKTTTEKNLAVQAKNLTSSLKIKAPQKNKPQEKPKAPEKKEVKK